MCAGAGGRGRPPRGACSRRRRAPTPFGAREIGGRGTVLAGLGDGHEGLLVAGLDAAARQAVGKVPPGLDRARIIAQGDQFGEPAALEVGVDAAQRVRGCRALRPAAPCLRDGAGTRGGRSGCGARSRPGGRGAGDRGARVQAVPADEVQVGEFEVADEREGDLLGEGESARAGAFGGGGPGHLLPEHVQALRPAGLGTGGGQHHAHRVVRQGVTDAGGRHGDGRRALRQAGVGIGIGIGIGIGRAGGGEQDRGGRDRRTRQDRAPDHAGHSSLLPGRGAARSGRHPVGRGRLSG